jgi:hypothetical protein
MVREIVAVHGYLCKSDLNIKNVSPGGCEQEWSHSCCLCVLLGSVVLIPQISWGQPPTGGIGPG